MRELKFKKSWIPALFLALAIAGCGDNDKNAGTGNPGDPLTPPTVLSVTPADSTQVCPDNAVITATFSKAMNAATLTTSTFTVSMAGASVSGQVTYVAATNVVTFTPTTPLTASSSFTATITTGAKDTFGNSLAAPRVWTFTTSA